MMADRQGPKLSLTTYLSLRDLLEVKNYADANGMSDSGWVAALIRKVLYNSDDAGEPVPMTKVAFLVAVAEEWLWQLPVGIREEARARVEKRARALSAEQVRGLVP